MKFAFFAAALAAAFASPFVMTACSSSSGIDTTEYKPPDAGRPDAVYCVSDPDCRLDGSTQKCGFPVSDSCEARGVCVDVTTGACSNSAPLCGCSGDLVTTCGAPSGYVLGGPTNGQTPSDVDGSARCPLGG